MAALGFETGQKIAVIIRLGEIRIIKNRLVAGLIF
ncbi:hypothetical protein [Winslowiella toletana]|nr:hypothetical protein [Winslowiella toletana]WNN45508.1 hypothetical protein RIN69_06350 [Winslowiella toletana]